MNKDIVAYAASRAKRRHQRRLKTALTVFCDAVVADAGARGPIHIALWEAHGPLQIALWEAKVLGLDDGAFDALIEGAFRVSIKSHRQHRIGNIITHMPLPIAA